MRFVAWMILGLCALVPAPALAGSLPASVARTTSVEFLGTAFARKWESTRGPVRRYEYYPPRQTPDDWLELVEFQVYPVALEGNDPVHFAARLARDFKRRYPRMRYALYTDRSGDAAILDFIYPTSTRKEKGKKFLEYDAFKFFRDPGDPHVLCFHYAKNIEGPSRSRPAPAVGAQIRKTRHEVIPALARFPVYGP